MHERHIRLLSASLYPSSRAWVELEKREIDVLFSIFAELSSKIKLFNHFPRIPDIGQLGLNARVWFLPFPNGDRCWNDRIYADLQTSRHDNLLHISEPLLRPFQEAGDTSFYRLSRES